MILILIMILLFYCNLIRFLELRESTNAITWKQYWVNKKGIVYSLNIVGIILIVYLISLAWHNKI
jgi:formate/nitrite transporter FocA (FNT family)